MPELPHIPQDEQDPDAAKALLELALEFEDELLRRINMRSERLKLLGITNPTIDELRLYEARAIRAATQKALAAGFNRGTERMAFELIDKTGMTVELKPAIFAVRDIWADAYGTESPEERR